MSDRYDVLWLGRSKDGCWWYRAEQPRRWLAERGYDIRSTSFEDPGDLGAPAAIVLQRLSYLEIEGTDQIVRLIRLMQRVGCRAYYELDDNLWLNNMIRLGGIVAFPRKLRKALEGQMERIIARCDGVIVTTAALGDEVARRVNRHVHPIDNAVPASLCRMAVRPHEGIRVGWVGSLSHQLEGDFAPLLPALRRVLDAYPAVTLVFMGHRPPGTEGWPRVEHHAWVPVETYYAKLAELGLDLFIAPLADTRFNVAKSASKLYEAAALGLPIIASPHGPYRDHEDIVAAYAMSEAEWDELLRFFVRSPAWREDKGAQARAYVREHHTMDQTGPLWERLLIGVNTEPLTVG